MKAQIGYAPWDAFHVGFSKSTGISIEAASPLTGVVIGIVAILLGEKLRLGTIMKNM